MGPLDLEITVDKLFMRNRFPLSARPWARSSDRFNHNQICSIVMPEVEVKKGESIDRALKRLKGKMENEGIMEEIRRLRAFETPTQKAKRKARSNAKRNRNRPRFTLTDPKPKSDDDSDS